MAVKRAPLKVSHKWTGSERRQSVFNPIEVVIR
jgi:hypothetical protein